ncbi:hypothetical protein D3105_23955 [Streptomyces globisporus]|uniref:Uncharacterized protein n=1 Tax=Streptomyces globisporus TaxID=1908 RepID=A0A423UUP5_STRGL|nr:hypothetical protein D3105_23955 [Streptomyces globisporus]
MVNVFPISSCPPEGRFVRPVDGSLSPDATSRSRPRPVGAVGCAGIVADGRPVRRVPRIGRGD